MNIILISINFNICFEMVLLSTHKICFGSEIRKIFLILLYGERSGSVVKSA